jgi:hypothetical protein
MVHWPVHMYSVLDVRSTLRHVTGQLPRPAWQQSTCGRIPEPVIVVEFEKIEFVVYYNENQRYTL